MSWSPGVPDALVLPHWLALTFSLLIFVGAQRGGHRGGPGDLAVFLRAIKCGKNGRFDWAKSCGLKISMESMPKKVR